MSCVYQLTTGCGDTFALPFNTPHTAIVDVTGGGMPQVELQTKTAVGRAGERITGKRDTSRTITVTMLLCTCNRCQAQVQKDALYAALCCEGGCVDGSACLPLRGVEKKYCFLEREKPAIENANCTLTQISCDAKGFPTRRSIQVTFAGMTETYTDRSRKCLQLDINFFAPYPYAFTEPIQSVKLVNDNIADDVESDVFCFPICEDIFPSVFEHCFSVDYQGQLPSCPKMFFHGTWRNPYIKNLTTGQEIALNYTIRQHEVVTVDLATIGAPSITTNYGANLLTSDAIDVNTCITDFCLKAGCVNELCIGGEFFGDRTMFCMWFWNWWKGFC